MNASRHGSDDTDHFKLRRCILELLYALFQETPFAEVELAHIEDSCASDARELNWNMVYLEKCGYIEMNKSADCVTHVGFAAAITAAGIDLVENRSVFQNRFPIQDR